MRLHSRRPVRRRPTTPRRTDDHQSNTPRRVTIRDLTGGRSGLALPQCATSGGGPSIDWDDEGEALPRGLLPRRRREPASRRVHRRVAAAAQAVLDQQIERLNLLGPDKPHLPFPHSSQIEGELRELRCHFGSSLYRVLYRRSANRTILLHMFRKDTGRVPEREIEVARVRWEDFRARMDAPRRRAPRAAGRDAP